MAEIVSDPALFAQWRGELEGMSGRIGSVRQELVKALTARNKDKDWGYITQQIGMFSFTGMTPAQVRSACRPAARRARCSRFAMGA